MNAGNKKKWTADQTCQENVKRGSSRAPLYLRLCNASITRMDLAPGIIRVISKLELEQPCPIAVPTIRDSRRKSGGSWLGTKLRNDGTQLLVHVAVDNGLDPVELLEQDDLIDLR